MKIRILTLNIHKGFSFWGKKPTLEELKGQIRTLGADVVCLQEVVGLHQVFAQQSQFEYLADQIWDHYAYGKNAVYTKGHHGNAILSHFPFAFYENVDISNHRFERRGILHGVVSGPDWGETRLHVMTVHLDLSSWGRRRQLKRLCAHVREQVPQNEPLVITGDFNDWKEEVSEVLLREGGLKEAHLSLKGEHAQTFPSHYPVLRLDRIYARGVEIQSVECLQGGVWAALSDHLGLMADLELYIK